MNTDSREFWVSADGDRVELRRTLHPGSSAPIRYSMHGQAAWIPINSYEELPDARLHLKAQGYAPESTQDKGSA